MTTGRRSVLGPGSGWVAVAWFSHRRTESICRDLGIPLHVLATRRRGALRYLTLSLRTIHLLIKTRPRVLLVQNPSIGTAVLATLLRPIFRYRLFIDAHNEAVTPYIHDRPAIRRIAAWLLRRADRTLVTNEALAAVVTQAGGHPFVLFDPIPVPPAVEPALLGSGPNVVVISTFAPDEPLAVVLEAAAALPEFTFHVTGRLPDDDVRAAIGRVSNVRPTGFLPDGDYWALLRGASVILDLTDMPNCLVCGGYEAIAVARPLVLTDDPAARNLFGAAALYTENRSEPLVSALRAAVASAEPISEAAAVRARELKDLWYRRAEVLIGPATP